MTCVSEEVAESYLMESHTNTSCSEPDTPAEQIGTPEAAATILHLAMATGDRDVVLRSLGVLALSKGMADALAWAGLPYDYLHRVLEADGRHFIKALRALSNCLTASLLEPMVVEP
ncbi:hypothetical protein BH10PSE3_BH10PSE3_09310 [soil metagenome]